MKYHLNSKKCNGTPYCPYNTIHTRIKIDLFSRDIFIVYMISNDTIYFLTQIHVSEDTNVNNISTSLVSVI